MTFFPGVSTRPQFIGSEVYRRSTYGERHPLSIPRVPLTIDLCRALGWLRPDDYVECRTATVAELGRFHDPAYIAVIQEGERTGHLDLELMRRHNLGKLENPVHPTMFLRPATAVGATLAAVDLVADGGTVYNPAGGTHHGQRDRAAGFCYFNDPVIGILDLLDRGIAPVAYVDLDLHHGDGVEAAFAGDARVLCLSIHEAGRWPHTGRADDRAGGSARNFPVPPGMNDCEFDYLGEAAILPLLARLKPQAIFVQGGADALADDPMGGQELSNGAYWRMIARLKDLCLRLIVVGGGGYNPWAVARCWAGNWAVLAGEAVPDRLPPAAEALLRQVTWNRSQGRNPPQHWFTTLADAPRPGPVRDAVKHLADLALAP